MHLVDIIAIDIAIGIGIAIGQNLSGLEASDTDRDSDSETRCESDLISGGLLYGNHDFCTRQSLFGIAPLNVRA
jgi:hypothetical protein